MLAFVVGSTLSSVVYGVGAHDPELFGAAAVVLLGTALLAAWAPARRAVRVDPVEALRGQ
jgi:ABC-type antimicrobial peptide transport system permease subunit